MYFVAISLQCGYVLICILLYQKLPHAPLKHSHLTLTYLLQLKTQLNDTLSKLQSDQSERHKLAADLLKVRNDGPILDDDSSFLSKALIYSLGY